MNARNLFGLALQFMTRLPVPWAVVWSEEAQRASARYYPAVGLVVGTLCGLVYLVALALFPPGLAVVLALGAGMLITGGLHEDGLADTADGLGGGATRARALEIMRDSSVGAYGLLAIVMALALKGAALVSLPSSVVAVAFITAHGISRYACVWVIHRHSYARAEGSKFAAPQIDAAGHRFALVFAMGAAVALAFVAGLSALVALGLAAGAVWVLTQRALKKLDGYTGDTLGATQQAAEIAIYIGLVAWL